VHILIFLDQNPDSLGGAQASVLLQQKYLQLAGHTVTVVGPTNRKSPVAGSSRPGQILYPSFPLTPDGEYTATAALNRTYRFVLQELKALPPVDVVHNQADWWGAILANGFAKRQNLPLVQTLHTNLVTGSAAAVGALGAGILTWVNGEVFGRWVNHKAFQGGIDGWRYLHNVCRGAQIVIAPTHHFAKLAESHGVAKDIRVIPTGVDDRNLEAIFKAERRPATAAGHPVTFAWSGRFSHEKRMMEFLSALALAKVPAKVRIFGGGPLLKKAQAFIASNGLQDSVELVGRVSHDQMLHELRAAHALIQTSIGFETQGMTVYEAGVVGTPAILCDPNIAGELPGNGYWLVPLHPESKQLQIEALAETIKAAHAEILDGKSKTIDLRQDLYQSNLVAKSVAIYQEAIAAHKK
jgi:glycosyltransferase involved in cell wall biosynthesis